MERINLSFGEIDGVLFVSQSRDFYVPRTSALLQYRLGIPNSAVALDFHLGCTGYVYGLFEAMLLIESGYCKNVLVCVGDTISRLVNPSDQVLRMEIGDAGTATLVSHCSADTMATFSFLTDGKDACAMMTTDVHKEETCGSSEINDNNMEVTTNLHMDGMQLMRFALSAVPPVVQSVLENVGWKQEKVDLFAMHQPGVLVLQYLAKKMGLSQEKIPASITKTGNTGGASIPLLLCNLYASETKHLKRTVLCGFGAGLSCAAGALSLQETHICATTDYD